MAVSCASECIALFDMNQMISFSDPDFGLTTSAYYLGSLRFDPGTTGPVTLESFRNNAFMTGSMATFTDGWGVRTTISAISSWLTVDDGIAIYASYISAGQCFGSQVFSTGLSPGYSISIPISPTAGFFASAVSGVPLVFSAAHGLVTCQTLANNVVLSTVAPPTKALPTPTTPSAAQTTSIAAPTSSIELDPSSSSPFSTSTTASSNANPITKGPSPKTSSTLSGSLSMQTTISQGGAEIGTTITPQAGLNSAGQTGAAPTSSSSSDSGLSQSAKIGIGLGVGIGLALILVLIGFLVWRRQAARKSFTEKSGFGKNGYGEPGTVMDEPGVAVD